MVDIATSRNIGKAQQNIALVKEDTEQIGQAIINTEQIKLDIRQLSSDTRKIGDTHVDATAQISRNVEQIDTSLSQSKGSRFIWLISGTKTFVQFKINSRNSLSTFRL